MVWLSIALLSAAVRGATSIIDSHLLSRRMPSLFTFLLPLGIINLPIGGVALAIFPFPDDLSIYQLGVAIIAGTLLPVSLIATYYALIREDVSRVVPVVYTYPILVALMAVPLLGETLLPLHWLAITIVVAGAVLVSLKRNRSGAGIRLGKSFYLLLGSSLLMAGADVASKYALNYLSFWNLFTITTLSLSLLFLSLSMRFSVVRRLKSMNRLGLSISLIFLNEFLAAVGMIFTFWAIQEGPVSLASTIIGSRPVFVFIYATILSRVYPPFLEWHPRRATLVLRFIATIMVVSGIAIIHQLSL